MDKCLVVMFADAAFTNQLIDVTDLVLALLKKQSNAYFFMQRT